MTMAKPGLAQDQTVEEILASIRQVINGDQARPASGTARPAPAATPSALPQRNGSTVTAIHGGKVAASDEAALDSTAAKDAAPNGVAPKATAPKDFRPGGNGGAQSATAEPDDDAEVHDVIELAIEQALDALDPDRTRAETGSASQADGRSPQPMATRPRVEVHPPRDAHRAPMPQPARTAARMPELRPPREAPRMGGSQPSREAPPADQPSRPALPSRSLLSPRTNAAVAASFDDLARVLARNGARDIDQAVEDVLRPMLKNWLEDNLPSLVERLVREEIERVSRGGR